MDSSPYIMLFQELAHLIEQGKQNLARQVNQTMTLVYWQVGKHINQEVLQEQRAAYGQEVIERLAKQLVERFGRSFAARNLRRMMRFAEEFPDQEIVATLSSQLSWSHFVELVQVKDESARTFYAKKPWKTNGVFGYYAPISREKPTNVAKSLGRNYQLRSLNFTTTSKTLISWIFWA